MSTRIALIAAVVAMFLPFQPAAAQSPPDAAAPPETAPVVTATLSHSLLKAITYKIGTTAVNVTVLSIAAGGVAAGAALTVFGTAASMAVYAVNDYTWDTHAPPPPPKPEEGQSFNLSDEFWRITKKFATYQPGVLWIKAIKAASVYAYTTSATTTMAAISATTAINAGVFYANNFAWDYYDSLTVTPPAALPPSPPAAPPLPAVTPVAEAASAPAAVPRVEAMPKS